MKTLIKIGNCFVVDSFISFVKTSVNSNDAYFKLPPDETVTPYLKGTNTQTQLRDHVSSPHTGEYETRFKNHHVAIVCVEVLVQENN